MCAAEGKQHGWRGQETSGKKWNLNQTLKKMGRILIDGERGCCRHGGAQQEESTKCFSGRSKWAGLAG